MPEAYLDGSVFGNAPTAEPEPTKKNPEPSTYSEEAEQTFGPNDDPYDAAESSSSYSDNKGASDYGYNSADSSATYSTESPSSAYGYNESKVDSTNYVHLAQSTDGLRQSLDLKKKASAPEPTVTSIIPVPSYKQKDWNREFQEILKREETEEKYLALSHLANEFGPFTRTCFTLTLPVQLAKPPSSFCC